MKAPSDPTRQAQSPLGDLRAGATAVPLGLGAAWVGGGIAATVVAIVLAVVFPSLLRYAASRP